jgi:DNA-binding winged helix-turn-helix (wHTH) protein
VTYLFAGFSVNSDTRQVLADEGEVRLSPKAFELLLMLLEHRTRVLSKAELQDRLWPSTFVGDANLPTLIAEVRRALGDTAHDSAYVRTVHRFGYRFVAEAEEVRTARADAASRARMYLTTGDRRFLLEEGAALIGRAGDATIRIDSGGVSRHHARIVVSGHQARVEDLGSKNGTFVEGEPVTAARLLRDGDEIRVGPVALTFSVAPPTRATETMS